MRLLVVALIIASCGRSPVDPTEPDLVLSSSVLHFDARPGEAVAEQIITLDDAHDLALEWHALVGAPWINVDPRQGRTGATPVRISVNTRNLAPGTHSGGVTFVVEGEEDQPSRVGLVIELTIDAPGWTALAGPGCGHFRSIAVDPNDSSRVFAGGTDGEILFSGDGGVSFQELTIASLDDEALVEQTACSSGGRAYLAVSTSCEGAQGVLRSNDGGVTWQPTGLMNVAIRGVGTLPADPDFVVAAGAGLWLSTDGGASWSVVDAGLAVERLSADPASPGTFYLTAHDRKLYTTDGGAPRLLTTPVDMLDLVSRSSGGLAAAADTSPYQIHLSSDGGSSWSQAAGLGLPHGEYGVPFALATDGNDLIALHDRLYVSRDGGEAFQSIPLAHAPLSINGYMRDAAAHPDGLLVAHGSDGILRYVGGRLEPLAVSNCAIRDLEVHPSGTLFGIASPGGAFRYQSGAGFEGLAAPLDADGQHNAISPDPRNASTVLIGSNTTCTGVHTTYDGGGSWTQNTLGLPEDFATVAIDRAPGDPDTIVLALNYAGAYRSTDNGLSYAQIAAHQVGQVAVLSSTLVLVNGNDGLWRWDNGVLTQIAAFDASPELVVRAGDGSVFAGRYNRGLSRSTDDGVTWVDLGMAGETPFDVVVHPDDPTWMFLANDTGLFESRDNGASWSEAGAPFVPRSLAFDASGVLYVGTRGGGVYRYAP